jgi:hypothetical protein
MALHVDMYHQLHQLTDSVSARAIRTEVGNETNIYLAAENISRDTTRPTYAKQHHSNIIYGSDEANIRKAALLQHNSWIP